MNDIPTARRPDPAGLAVSGLLAGLAALVVFDMAGLQLGVAYGVGPKAMPGVVAAGLAVLALANLVSALRGDLPEADAVDWGPVLLILGGFAALIAIIGIGGGFVPATAVLFAATAAAFGRRTILADLAIGFAIGLGCYLLFAKLLSLTLPTGPLESLI